MKTNNLVILGVVILAVGFLIWVLNSTPGEPSKFAGMQTTVYMSPTCGCCKNYVAYLQGKGFKVETIITGDMQTIKKEYNIPEFLQSCHTTIIGDYVVEGHIPVEGIDKLLTDKPEIRGIALPGMPPASPGMPGDKLGPFEIYKLLDGDKIETFVSI